MVDWYKMSATERTKIFQGSVTMDFERIPNDPGYDGTQKIKEGSQINIGLDGNGHLSVYLTLSEDDPKYDAISVVVSSGEDGFSTEVSLSNPRPRIWREFTFVDFEIVDPPYEQVDVEVYAVGYREVPDPPPAAPSFKTRRRRWK